MEKLNIFTSLAFLLAVAGVTACAPEGPSGKPSGEQPASVSFRDGQFKIVQLTDIHYKVGSRESAASLKRMGAILDAERPDMVVFTGDVVLCAEMRRGWDEVLEPVISRDIRWAAVMGNHDDEHTMTREQIVDYLAAKPGSLTSRGPDELTGTGNYAVTVDNAAGNPAALLYFMDSGSYSTIDGIEGYGWFGFDQVEWYRAGSRKFTSENGGKPLPALAFFHIPLPECQLLADSVLVGTRGELECPGALDTGMYAAMIEAGDVMCTFSGHDHNNDYIATLNGLGLAYGRFSGSRTTYTDIGYGARVIELKEGERAFDTWIRTGDGDIINAVDWPGSFTSAQR